jgi:site-specific recombinase XerD
LNEELKLELADFSEITLKQVERYLPYLQMKGYQTNSRRRKVLTLRRFLRFLHARGKIAFEMSDQIPAPYKVERVPNVVDYKTLRAKLLVLPTQTIFESRNKALMLVLLETGLQVSEVAKLKYANFEGNVFRITLAESTRSFPISEELQTAIERIKDFEKSENPTWIFSGFNKFGPLQSGQPITPRGVELLVKSYSVALGFPEITPRSFRQSTVLNWFQEGVTKKEIQERLGLQTDYAFRVFAPLLSESEKVSANESELINEQSI